MSMSNPLQGMSKDGRDRVMVLVRQIRAEELAKTDPHLAQKRALRQQRRALDEKIKALNLPRTPSSAAVEAARAQMPPRDLFGCEHGAVQCDFCYAGALNAQARKIEDTSPVK